MTSEIITSNCLLQPDLHGDIQNQMHVFMGILWSVKTPVSVMELWHAVGNLDCDESCIYTGIHYTRRKLQYWFHNHENSV